MAYVISDSCVSCGTCEPECPVGAISQGDSQFQIDEGACVELGIAYGIGKRCYGFKTDTRSVELGLDLNPMISGCMIKVFKSYDGDKLIEEIQQYLSQNKL